LGIGEVKYEKIEKVCHEELHCILGLIEGTRHVQKDNIKIELCGNGHEHICTVST
jgi:hypothetical protein